ncbi:MAG: enhanced intracellular survival protein Eis [Candidatus Hodarchaeota archaeon]
MEYKRVYDVALGINYGDGYFPDEDHPNENIFGAFENENLVSAAYIFDYEVKIRNNIFKMGGFEGVLTRPGHRGKGYSSKLFQHIYKTLNERGQFIAVLFPILHVLYKNRGFGLADEQVFHQFKFKNINPLKFPNRSWKMVEGINDDIKCIYDEASKRFNYTAQRYDSQWKLKEKQSEFKFVCFDENNRPVGYCFLKFLKEHYLFKNPSKTLHILEAFWLDNTTKHSLFQDFILSFSDQREYGSIVLPLGENLIELFKDDIIEIRAIKPSSRLRIINAKECLSKLQYSVQNFKLAIRIHDKHCDWNNKTLVLESNDGDTTISEDASIKDVDLDIDITALAQLFVGSRSIVELSEFQNIKVKAEFIDLINKLFPKQVNFFRDFF